MHLKSKITTYVLLNSDTAWWKLTRRAFISIYTSMLKIFSSKCSLIINAWAFHMTGNSDWFKWCNDTQNVSAILRYCSQKYCCFQVCTSHFYRCRDPTQNGGKGRSYSKCQFWGPTHRWKFCFLIPRCGDVNVQDVDKWLIADDLEFNMNNNKIVQTGLHLQF